MAGDLRPGAPPRLAQGRAADLGRAAARPSAASLVPMVVPIVIVVGFYFGVFTATEAGALVAAYAVAAALLYYRNVTPCGDAEARLRERAPDRRRRLPAGGGERLPVPDGHAGRAARCSARSWGRSQATPWLFLVAVSRHRHPVRDGAGGAAGRGGARPGRLPDRQADRHPPDPLQRGADGRRRHRSLPAADRRRAAHGPALRRHQRRPALPRVLALPAGAVRGPAPPHPVPRDHAVPAAPGRAIRSRGRPRRRRSPGRRGCRAARPRARRGRPDRGRRCRRACRSRGCPCRPLRR